MSEIVSRAKLAFYRKVHDLDHAEIVLYDNENKLGETSVMEFGYKHQIGDTIHTVTDWGNIWKHFEAELSTLTTALENARKDAWQPIETAPKDGSTVLLHSPDVKHEGGVMLGYWTDFGDGDPNWTAIQTEYPIDAEVTHWMPLPEPPTPPTEKAS